MRLVRHSLYCLMIAIVFALSANGVAMAANDLDHQTHCIDAMDATENHTVSDHARHHDHDGSVSPHAASGHDHETCMTHACPALSAKSVKLGEMADVLLAKLSWPERQMHVFERADGLKRPPKS